MIISNLEEISLMKHQVNKGKKTIASVFWLECGNSYL